MSCLIVSGYCGHGPEYCQAPDCQFEYGSGCDALKWPEGEPTYDVPRPHAGEVPYGWVPIYQCVKPNTIALTYDDGPNIYTHDLLDILDSYDAKATFFVSAFNSNKGGIDDPNYPWADLIRRMYNSGHQIAGHTWSHQNLDQMSGERRREQMIKTEMALRNIFGGFPTYMRPPYSACSVSTGCLSDMNDLGYHVTYFNVDTDDYNNASPHQIQRSKDLFDHSMAMHEATGRPMLVIAHDVHEQTVYNLTIHMLRRLYQAGYTPVTVGECLGDPSANWYRWTDTTAAVSDTVDSGVDHNVRRQKPVSNDGTCGKEYTCTGSKFGRCCSTHGFCGNGIEHCGEGCQETSGECLFNPSEAQLPKSNPLKRVKAQKDDGQEEDEDNEDKNYEDQDNEGELKDEHGDEDKDGDREGDADEEFGDDDDDHHEDHDRDDGDHERDHDHDQDADEDEDEGEDEDDE